METLHSLLADVKAFLSFNPIKLESKIEQKLKSIFATLRLPQS